MFNAETKKVRKLTDAEEKLLEAGLVGEINNANEFVTWLVLYDEEIKRRKKEEALERREAGLREAVARWRRKAGVADPVEDVELVAVEMRRDAGRKVRLEYYALPVERGPEFLEEALECAEKLLKEEKFKKWDRLYCDQKWGWTIVVKE